MEKYEINQKLENISQNLKDLKTALNLTKTNQTLQKLNDLMQKPSFWNDPQKAIKINQKFNDLQEKKDILTTLENNYQDLVTFFNLEDDQNNETAFLEEELKNLAQAVSDFKIKIFLNQPYDNDNAILIFHPGAGGTESQDWCEMLFRMYQKYAIKKNFKTEILDYQSGDEAGIKSATLLVKGDFAYGYLKAEKGVHRLVRVSPFDSNAKRHTSFVSCDVLPEIKDEIKINVKPEDLKIDVFRSSGAGGQHVNTTDSAVRITHLPTGLVVGCQNERSQIKNREKALQMLKTKLFQLALKEQKEETVKQFQSDQKEIGWGSQIRSYVFHPYKMVKDHRTNQENFQLEQVMDGNLDDFINGYLTKIPINKISF
ncbi:peptide chain release factor 2 [Candidatus Phytoplasma solani]|uniref:Peptide chain release factor 2 n=2 Tax=Candidatus Phytoplasma solani TaxID=69896 RepID=A0A421NXG4_9MOLU|nr:peptide chain release factor 2 [Candidatus Phytoplasma solani]RMI88634.1 peptide chain release factor 2 [Candidatus Phytoplasma solani]CCP88388.1 Peptide chain release factor 2 [Candidatus Phytoplasma solani]